MRGLAVVAPQAVPRERVRMAKEVKFKEGSLDDLGEASEVTAGIAVRRSANAKGERDADR